MNCVLCIQKHGIQFNCNKILEYCRDVLIANRTKQTRVKLCAYRDILESTWALYSKAAIVKDVKDLLSHIQSIRKQVYEGTPKLLEDTSISSTGSLRNYTTMLDSLRGENDGLRKQLTEEVNSTLETKKKYEDAVASLQSSEVSLKEREIAEDARPSKAAIDNLCSQLAEFLKLGEKVALLR